MAATTGSGGLVSLPPALDDYHRRLLLTRLLAALIVLAAGGAAFFILPDPLTPPGLLLLGGVLLLLNAAFWQVGRTAPTATLPRLLTAQVVLDALALLVFIYLTGGLASPARFFFVLHAIVVAILAPGWRPYLYVAGVVAALSTLATLEAIGTLPSHPLIDTTPPPTLTDPRAIALDLTFLTTGLIAAAFITTSIADPLRQRERYLRALFDTTRAASASLDLDTVLTTLAEHAREPFNAVSVTLHLLDVDGDGLNMAAWAGHLPHGLQRLQRTTWPIYDRALFGETLVVPAAELSFASLHPASHHAILAPLMGQQPLGVLTIIRPASAHDTIYARAFAQSLADSAVVAIQHARAYTALQSAETQRTQFVHIVTHELRAPVTGAQSLMRVLLGNLVGDLTAQQRDILSRLSTRLDSLLVLINDLLDLAAIQTREFQEQLSPTPLAAALTTAIDHARDLAAEKHHTLHLPTADALSAAPHILATPTGLTRIFDNLIGNAVKYTPPGGTVTVALTQHDRYIHIAITDTGIGIPPDALAHLGDEFYRAPNAKESGIVGTGLGLATVKKLILHYGGQLHIESQVGHGSTFTVQLPTRPPADP